VTCLCEMVDKAQVVVVDLSRAHLHDCAELAMQPLIFRRQVNLRRPAQKSKHPQTADCMTTCQARRDVPASQRT
jgi:hypothetical protein